MIVYVSRDATGKINGVYPLQQPGLADEQIDDQSAEVIAFLTPRVTRPLLSIYNDVKALSAANQNAVWTDLNGGNPPKWSTDVGTNAGAIMALQWAATFSGAAAAGITEAKIRVVAMYAQDNVNYLVHPAFAPTINLPGDQPVS